MRQWRHMAIWVWVNIGLGNGLLPHGTMSKHKQLPEYLLLKVGNLHQLFTNSSLLDKSLKIQNYFRPN